MILLATDVAIPLEGDAESQVPPSGFVDIDTVKGIP